MVMGHSGCPDPLNQVVYMFRMPCFFFVSGWWLSDRYITNLKTGLLYKAKGAYNPFVKYSLIFLMLHNVFAWMHFYSDTYSLQDIAVNVVRIFTMTGSEQLLGGYWFLISLVWAAVLTLLVLAAFQRIRLLKKISKWQGVFLLLLLAIIENYLPVNIPSQFSERTVLAAAFYMTGYLVHKEGFDFSKIRYKTLIGLAFLSIPAIASFFIAMSMSTVTGWTIILYYVIAMIGTFGVVLLSNVLSTKPIASFLTYIGSKTLYILTFHFLSFKFVSFIYIISNGQPMSRLSEFPILENSPSYLWLVYVIVGVAVPILFWEVNDKITAAVTKLWNNRRFLLSNSKA